MKALEFRKLILASFISQIGSHFLTLAISGYVFLKTGSAIYAGLVFVFSFLPSLFVSSRLGAFVDQNVSMKLLIQNDLFSSALTLLIGTSIYYSAPIFITAILLSIRSIFLFVGKSASTKWLKEISPKETQALRFKVSQFAFFLSTAVSGILTSIVLAEDAITKIVAIDIVTYLCAITIFSTLKKLEVHSSHLQKINSIGITDTLKDIFSNRELRAPFLLVCSSQGLFQSIYSVLVSYLPLKHLALEVSYVGPFQVAASVGIILGFVAVTYYKQVFDKKENKVMPVLLFLAAIVCVISVVKINALVVSVTLFFLINFFYECIWLKASSDFFQTTSQDKMARFQFVLFSVASFYMAVSIFGYSYLIESVGFQLGTLLFIAASISLSLILAGVAIRDKVIVGRPMKRAAHE